MTQENKELLLKDLCPHYFAGTLLCWDVDIISWHDSIKSARGVCGRYKLCNQANLAGIEYVVDRLN